MAFDYVRPQAPKRLAARVADKTIAIFLSHEHPQLAIDRTVPIPQLRPAPVRVVTPATEAFATAPATIARVPRAYLCTGHGSIAVRRHRLDERYMATRQRENTDDNQGHSDRSLGTAFCDCMVGGAAAAALNTGIVLPGLQDTNPAHRA